MQEGGGQTDRQKCCKLDRQGVVNLVGISRCEVKVKKECQTDEIFGMLVL